MIFRVLKIDQYGFNGRDFHPEIRHIGKLVRPLKLETWLVHDAGMDCALDEAGETMADGVAQIAKDETDGVATRTGDDCHLLDMWTCVTEDGELLQLVEHELELFRS